MNSPLIISTRKKIELRKQSHHLNPIIIIGNRGLTEAVLAETKRALQIHQLIKIKVLDEKETLDNHLLKICNQLKAIPIQKLGKTFVIWQKQREKSSPIPAFKEGNLDKNQPKNKNTGSRKSCHSS